MLLSEKPAWLKVTVAAAAVLGLGFNLLATKLHGVGAYTGLAPAVAALSAGFLPPLWALAGAALPLILGALGLPVLPGANAGIGFFASGAGGYALAPLLFAGLGGLFLRSGRGEGPGVGAFALGLVAALLASNLVGTLWLVCAGGHTWGEALERGTLWMALGDLFRSVIAFSVFFFFRREERRRGEWEKRLRTRRQRMDERYELLDAVEGGKAGPEEGGEVAEEEMERARRELEAREEEDLPPYFKL
jgi:biotin transporter BioY